MVVQCVRFRASSSRTPKALFASARRIVRRGFGPLFLLHITTGTAIVMVVEPFSGRTLVRCAIEAVFVVTRRLVRWSGEPIGMSSSGGAWDMKQYGQESRLLECDKCFRIRAHCYWCDSDDAMRFIIY